jgi:hypothetical protein
MCECFKSYEILVNWYPVVFVGSNVMLGPSALVRLNEKIQKMKKNERSSQALVSSVGLTFLYFVFYLHSYTNE